MQLKLQKLKKTILNRFSGNLQNFHDSMKHVGFHDFYNLCETAAN